MAFDDQYLVSDGPVNARTNEPYGKTTKSYSDWFAAQTKDVLSCKDYGFISKLHKSVWTRDIAGQPQETRFFHGIHSIFLLVPETNFFLTFFLKRPLKTPDFF